MFIVIASYFIVTDFVLVYFFSLLFVVLCSLVSSGYALCYYGGNCSIVKLTYTFKPAKLSTFLQPGFSEGRSYLLLIVAYRAENARANSAI